MKVTFDVTDADMEAGIEIQRGKYNAISTNEAIATTADFAAKLSLDALETYKALAGTEMKAKVDKLSRAELKTLEVAVDALIAAKVEAEPAEAVKP